MSRFSIAFSSQPRSRSAAAALAERIELELGGPERIAGGLLLATAAAGAGGPEIGAELASRWPEAGLVGTSFEGVLSEGRIWRDLPACALLAWSIEPDAVEPIAMLIDPPRLPSPSSEASAYAEALAAEILSAAGRDRFGPEDVLLVFPDAHGSPPIEGVLPGLQAGLGEAQLAGAAASGVDGLPAVVWTDGHAAAVGGFACVWIPGMGSGASGVPANVVTAGASRRASAWLPITECRRRWIDQLGGAPAIQALQDALRVSTSDAIEPQLGRLLAQLRVRSAEASPTVGPAPDAVASRPSSGLEPGRPSATDRDFDEERFIVGLDRGLGAFSLPTEVHRGQELALALPDADYARLALKQALDGLDAAPILLQFACRARDASLHGDPDLEPAWVAAHAPDRAVLGTVAPFQIGPGRAGQARVQVHSTVLAALR